MYYGRIKGFQLFLRVLWVTIRPPDSNNLRFLAHPQGRGRMFEPPYTGNAAEARQACFWPTMDISHRRGDRRSNASSRSFSIISSSRVERESFIS